MNAKLDALDQKILAELTRNARIPIAELARKVGLSKTPVALRIRHLEESGLISGYRAILSPLQLGLTHVTYVEVSMSDTRQKALEDITAYLRVVEEQLAVLPENSASQALRQLADYTVRRVG